MPVKYNVVEHKNLLDKTAASKFYAKAKVYYSNCRLKGINIFLFYSF